MEIPTESDTYRFVPVKDREFVAEQLIRLAEQLHPRERVIELPE
ncbi:MAG: hypothetical protein AAGF20_04855 [Pseudomonadota bacterium]